MAVPPAISDVLNTARGRRRRRDAALPRTGSPAGNARLTAWLGLTLLVLLLQTQPPSASSVARIVAGGSLLG
jgi:hypothetical protein